MGHTINEHMANEQFRQQSFYSNILMISVQESWADYKVY